MPEVGHPIRIRPSAPWIFVLLLATVSVGGCVRDPELALPFGPCLASPVRWGPTDAGPPSPPGSRFDVCGNGLDDDRNGTIDDGCSCSAGDVVRCYAGLELHAGVGGCSWGQQRCVGEGTTASWGTCVGSAASTAELCNQLDDDCDGAVDEACSCEPGATQPCFVGSLAELGVGPCSAGSQICVEGESLDGIPAGRWGPCVGAIGPESETCNATDDDCDGAVDELAELCDGVDNDCDTEVDEVPRCTALGDTVAMTRFWPPTASGVLTDMTTASLHTLVAVPGAAPCSDPGDILYEVAFGEVACVPAPPECEADKVPTWDRALGDWVCLTCELLVQYGYLFDFERSCGERPRLACPPGQVPTFDEAMRVWVCRPTCDDTTYDRAYADGMLVCVPC